MKIQVNEQSMELSEECSAKELADKLNLRAPHEALAVEINGTLFDLQHRLKEGDHVKFISFDEPKGKEVFWHTSRLWASSKTRWSVVSIFSEMRS